MGSQLMYKKLMNADWREWSVRNRSRFRRPSHDLIVRTVFWRFQRTLCSFGAQVSKGCWQERPLALAGEAN